MNHNELKFLRASLEGKINEIPDDKLEAVANFIDSCMDPKEKKIVKMVGIWKDSGFENIDVEQELKTIRRNSLDDLEQEFGT